MRAGLEKERWSFGAELEGGFSWGGLSPPFTIQLNEWAWFYTAPGLIGPAWRHDAFVRVPLGVVLRAANWIDFSLEVNTNVILDDGNAPGLVLVMGNAAALFRF